MWYLLLFLSCVMCLVAAVCFRYKNNHRIFHWKRSIQGALIIITVITAGIATVDGGWRRECSSVTFRNKLERTTNLPRAYHHHHNAYWCHYSVIHQWENDLLCLTPIGNVSSSSSSSCCWDVEGRENWNSNGNKGVSPIKQVQDIRLPCTRPPSLPPLRSPSPQCCL